MMIVGGLQGTETSDSMPKAPTDLDAGFVAHTAGRLSEARRWYEQALALEPGNCRALFLLGTLHAAENRTARAIAFFEKCIGLHPSLSIAHNALGYALHAAREIPRAAAEYRRAIDCPEPCVEAFCNLGAICRSLGQLDEAVSLYRRALVIQPDLVEAWCNLGVALKELKRLDDATDAFRQAIGIKPDLAEAHFNESLLLLLKGDFLPGWPKHEYRWATVQRTARRHFTPPLWLGDSSLEGKTILVHAEQGLGDTLQFVRYLPLLEQRGAKVILEVQPALKTLFSEDPRVQCLYARGETLPAFDAHCPLLSLPLAFSTGLDSIPGDVPYLHVPDFHRRKWDGLLRTSAGPRVGFVWFGNRQHRNDLNRSIPASAAGRFLEESPVVLHCLQKDIVNPEDAALAASPKMKCLTDQMEDFCDTAAFVERLDLVITVDTSVAHLAGGLGRPLWVLLPYVPDWRWLLERNDSPWYPRARLFRQPAAQDWTSVLRLVRDELESFCFGWKPHA